MKKWIEPNILKLGIENTYDEFCNWIDTGATLGLGNEDYTDPNNKPAGHEDWVWCNKHNRWHEKNHGVSGQS